MFSRKQKKINNCEPTKVWIWSLLGVFAFCFFSYGYCVRGAIVNIVNRQNMETELTSLSSRVISLESDYIKAKNEVTEEFAYQLGFISPEANQKFVIRGTEALGLSLAVPGN
jgi:hypothetical protein